MRESAGRQKAALLAAAAYLFMLAANVLANVQKLGGVTTAQRAQAYPNLFTPAPYTFAIWGLIYLLLGVFLFRQTSRKKKPGSSRRERYVKLALLGVALSCLLNAAWIYAWHMDSVSLSMLIMLLLLLCLLLVARLLREADVSRGEAFFVRVPVSVYLGWITAATLANAAALLVSLRWDGFGLPEEIWTAAALLLGLAAAVFYVVRYRDAAYGLAVLWAYGGILYQYISASGYDFAHPLVVYTAAACMLSLAAALVARFTKRKRR
jgi:hypothetical protein